MRKILKISLSLVLVLCILFGVFQTVSNADHSSEVMSFIKKDHNDSTSASEKVSNMSTTIIVTVRLIGTCVAVVMLLVLAMKYMFAAPGDKADIKKSAIPYVIGAVVLFSVVGILGIIDQFATNIKA